MTYRERIDDDRVRQRHQGVRGRNRCAAALDLAFNAGEFLVLLGPSGSGKTTACRLLAGLEQPTSGRILVEGRDVTSLPPRLRGMGMVFQNYALYSHKSVYENIAYPLPIRGSAGRADRSRCPAMADLLEIGRYLGRRPSQLSGGQAQRVAVARALVWQPSLCLMDEPLSNLDALLRLHMRTELKRLHRELKKTFVFVTHDQEEAMTLATRVAVLREGALVQFHDPRQIYRRPANRFIAEFIRRPAMNTFDGHVAGGIFQAAGFACPMPGRRMDPWSLASVLSRSRSSTNRQATRWRFPWMWWSWWSRMCLSSPRAVRARSLCEPTMTTSRSRPGRRSICVSAGSIAYLRCGFRGASAVSSLIALVPLAAAGLVSYLFYRLNRHRAWFSTGELIFWDVTALVVVQLIWLIWF